MISGVDLIGVFESKGRHLNGVDLVQYLENLPCRECRHRLVRALGKSHKRNQSALIVSPKVDRHA